MGKRIRGYGYPDAVELLYASPHRFDHTVAIYAKHPEYELSFTDAMTVALVQFQEIESVLSFDDDFDGIVDRLDPSTVAE